MRKSEDYEELKKNIYLNKTDIEDGIKYKNE